MAYTFDEPRLGMLPLASFDTGFIPPNNGTTAIPTPPNVLGGVSKATDPTYGQGEFILLKGVASTAVGSLVIYDPVTYATTLCPVTTNQARPVAVSMSANILATTFGWYQVEGSTVVLKSVGTKLSGSVAVSVKSTGKIGGTATGTKILGARNVVTATSAATTAILILDRPHLEGGVG